MTRDQKIAKARRLQAKGLKRFEIAEQLGVSGPTIYNWFHPEAYRAKVRRSNAKRGSYKRQWERENDRGTCSSCGQPTGIGADRKVRRHGFPGRCEPCRIAEENARTAERGRQIEEWWKEGLLLKEIAARLDWTVGHLGVEIARLRKRGFDLPHRHRYAHHI